MLKNKIIISLILSIFSLNIGYTYSSGSQQAVPSQQVQRQTATPQIQTNSNKDQLDLGNVLVKLELTLKTNPKEKKDLCSTTVNFPSRHDICQGNMNLERKEMPQLGGIPRTNSLASELQKFGVLVPNKFGSVDLSEHFIAYLKINDVPVKRTLLNLGQLKATQKEIAGSKVVGMWGALRANPNWANEIISQCSNPNQKTNSPTSGITAPLFISNDNYILDGHHRWAAIVGAYDAFTQNTQPQICVNVIDLPMSKLLNEAKAFAKVYGIPQEGV